MATRCRAVEPGLGAPRTISSSSWSKIALYNDGCAYCIDMHTKEARAARRDRAAHLRARRLAETPLLSARERAALDGTEAATVVGGTHVPDETYPARRRAFRRGRSS